MICHKLGIEQEQKMEAYKRKDTKTKNIHSSKGQASGIDVCSVSVPILTII